MATPTHERTPKATRTANLQALSPPIFGDSAKSAIWNPDADFRQVGTQKLRDKGAGTYNTARAANFRKCPIHYLEFRSDHSKNHGLLAVFAFFHVFSRGAPGRGVSMVRLLRGESEGVPPLRNSAPAGKFFKKGPQKRHFLYPRRRIRATPETAKAPSYTEKKHLCVFGSYRTGNIGGSHVRTTIFYRR